MENLDQIPLCYASVSIGCRPEHTLPAKLDAIAAAGFQAIELGFPDLVSFANRNLREQNSSNNSDEITESDYDALCTAGAIVKELCSSRNLKILILQPFANFEGWPENSPERADAFARLEGWIRVMHAVGTDMLQVGSSDTPAEKIGTERQRFVADLILLADRLAREGFRVAYENWCWSTHAPNWKDVWEICKAVDRENFGLCLDTFQSAGGEWGDPTTKSGLIEDGRSREEVEQDWKNSCDELARVVLKEKIFFLQISDAYKLEKPLKDEVVDELRPRGRWSHDYRPLPFKGYLPTVDFAAAVLKTGFRGWFSYEIFDSGPDGKGKDYDLEPFAKDAFECQKKLLEECSKES